MQATATSADTRDGHEMLRLLLQPPRNLCASTSHYPHTPQEPVQPHHCQGPVIQGQLSQENTLHTSGCCNVMLASAPAGSSRIQYLSLSPACVSQSPLISCYFNPLLSGQGTDALRRPTTHRGRAKSKPEPQELCEQRREREISPSSLRSSGLNLDNQLDVPCICGIPEETTSHPKIEEMDFGRKYRLVVCFLHIICFWFYVYLSLVFRPYYHW